MWHLTSPLCSQAGLLLRPCLALLLLHPPLLDFPSLRTDVVNHWPALTSWTNEYLCTVAGDAEVTVALTPNGRADAVTLLPGSRAEDCPHGRGAGERSGPAAASGLSSGDSDLEGAEDPSLAPVAQCGDCFALPHQVKLPLRDFLALLRPGLVAKDSSCSSKHGCPQRQLAGGSAPARSSPPVLYLQYQNSSLTAELPQLLGDVDPDLSWASEAFGAPPPLPRACSLRSTPQCCSSPHAPSAACAGGPPEALNLWIGDQRSITSWHKDPFENIYAGAHWAGPVHHRTPSALKPNLPRRPSPTQPCAVVAGSKTFSLMPPGDAFRMRLRRYPQATYQPAAASAAAASGGLALADVLSGSLRLEPVLNEPAEEVLWSSVPPPVEAAASASPALEAPAVGDLFSEPSLPPPLRVTVQAGEVLYLPAMWWHQVGAAAALSSSWRCMLGDPQRRLHEPGVCARSVFVPALQPGRSAQQNRRCFIAPACTVVGHQVLFPRKPATTS